MNPPAVLLIVGHAEAVSPAAERAQQRLSGERTRVFDDVAAAVDYLAACPPKDMPRLILVRAAPAECLDALRQLRPTPRGQLLPIVLLLSAAAVFDAATAAALGANSCLRLPDDPLQAENMIAQIMRYWLDLNIPPPST